MGDNFYRQELPPAGKVGTIQLSLLTPGGNREGFPAPVANARKDG